MSLTREMSMTNDKFYTKKETAQLASIWYIYVLEKEGIDLSNLTFIEPSAGDGVFVSQLKRRIRAIYGFDILPTGKDVTQCDFLKEDFRNLLPTGVTEPFFFIGNPPFGKKGDLAVQFINKCLTLSPYVGFILPLQFQKWSAQKRITKGAKLIFDAPLPPNAFTFMDKDYDIRCSFQVWSMTSTSTDLRIHEKPRTTHPDFEMWQYNRTVIAEKYFDQEIYGWDFAVPRHRRSKPVYHP